MRSENFSTEVPRTLSTLAAIRDFVVVGEESGVGRGAFYSSIRNF